MPSNQSSLSAVSRRRPARRRHAGPNRTAHPNRRPDDHGTRRPSADQARLAAVQAFDPTGSPFAALGVPDRIVQLLGVDGITEPTPIQTAVIPAAIAGGDMLGRARTGSGKTLAFGVPVLVRLAGRRSRPHHPRALIVVPTRELAGQVAAVVDPLARAIGLRTVTVYGGTSYERQIRGLAQGADVVVATPGRLDDLVRRGACKLGDVEVVTLDEADHLCDLGFFPVVSALLAGTPAGGQRLLLSATLDGDVDRLVRRHLVDPVRHEVDPDVAATRTVAHHVLVVGAHDKLGVTTELVRSNPRSIVFTRTKHTAKRLAGSLERAGVSAVDLHGDLSQRLRERNLDRFRTGQALVVVATDVAARGIHVDRVGLVVHYDPAGEAKSYLHRSGRTARAGASGAVVTVAMPDQARELVGLHRRAGIDAKHVDARTVSGSMTAQAIAQAPPLTHEPGTRSAGADRGSRTSNRRRRRRGYGRGSAAGQGGRVVRARN
jgi:superfamily II DNA/RNA helicase